MGGTALKLHTHGKQAHPGRTRLTTSILGQKWGQHAVGVASAVSQLCTYFIHHRVDGYNLDLCKMSCDRDLR